MLGWALICSWLTVWPFWLALFTNSATRAFKIRDMFVPEDMMLNINTTGADSNAPRAIPQDTFLAFLSPAIPGTVVASLLVIAASVLGVIYAMRMVRDMAGGRTLTQMAAGLFVVWNPFTIERFLQGQWSIAAAGMLLPALAYLAALGSRGRLAFFFALAAITPTGAVLAFITTLTFVQTWRTRILSFACFVVYSSPWVVSHFLHSAPSAAYSSPNSAALFAARADSFIGTLGTTISLGGVWNLDATAPSRELSLAVIGGLVLALFFLSGINELWRTYRGVSILTLSALILPALLATGPGLQLMGWLISTIPGAGLFRDTSKFVCLAIPGYVLLIAVLVGRVEKASRRFAAKQRAMRTEPAAAVSASNSTRLFAGALIIAIFLPVPTFTLDMRPLQLQELSSSWSRIITEISAAPSTKILILPPGNYQDHTGTPNIHPALKLLPGHPLDPGYLIVDGEITDGNSEVMQLLADTLDGNLRLKEAHVGWVLVDNLNRSHADLRVAEKAFEAAGYVHTFAAPDYELWQIPGTTPAPATAAVPAPITLVIYLAAALAGFMLSMSSFLQRLFRWWSIAQQRAAAAPPIVHR